VQNGNIMEDKREADYSIIKQWYNYLMDENDGILHEERIDLFLDTIYGEREIEDEENADCAVKAVVVNHGNVFGNGDWFTFHCPKCNATVRESDHKCDCGQIIKL
jgi:hypothetical protein